MTGTGCAVVVSKFQVPFAVAVTSGLVVAIRMVVARVVVTSGSHPIEAQ